MNVGLVTLSANADSGILNNPSPLPLKNPLPDGICILPLTIKLPLNVEPLATDFI